MFLYWRLYTVPFVPLCTKFMYVYHPPPLFSLPPAFDGNDVGYSFVANSAREQDEWCSAITSTRSACSHRLHRLVSGNGMFCCSYEHLRMAFSELRGQLMHLTGKVSSELSGGGWVYGVLLVLLQDPLVEDHPLGSLPVTVTTSISSLCLYSVCCALSPLQTVSAVPATAPAFEGDPVFELSLGGCGLSGNWS